MSRNDGRPKSVGALRLDPLPYVGEGVDEELNLPVRTRGKSVRLLSKYETVHFDPRPGFIQDEEAYP